LVNRVVVTGTGSISPLGTNWDEISSSLLSCENKVRYMHEWDQYPELQTRLASPVDNFAMPSHYTAKKRRGMGRVAQLAVVATEYALKDSGLYKEPELKNGRTGVSYGSATGSSEAAMEFFSLLENQSMKRINGSTYLRMMSHSAAVNISVVFGTSGRMYTTNSACTAGSQGIGYGYEAIKNGLQDIMIVGGAEELCPTQAAVFDTVYSASLKNDTPKLTPSPFDKDRDGLVLGEGATTLILENREHALARGASILGEVVGFATNTDGTHLVRPNKVTMAQVMEMALADAALSTKDIGYISGHGTATIAGDIAESHATNNVMGEDIPFSTMKSYVGHGLGASASLEALIGLKTMNENWFAPTLNLNELDFIRDGVRQIDTQYFMSNNFAFGGVNTSLIFARS